MDSFGTTQSLVVSSLRWLLNFHIDINWLRYFVSDEMLQRLDDLPVAYIISSGGNTLIPNVLLKSTFD